jgi:hypothetical protein
MICSAGNEGPNGSFVMFEIAVIQRFLKKMFFFIFIFFCVFKLF